MRNVVYAVLALAALTSIASAQPALTATTDLPAPAPARSDDAYLALGTMVGGNDGLLTAAAHLDGGHRIGDTGLWMHGAVAMGGSSPLFGDGTGTFSQLRLGVETHGCSPGRIACVVAGVDAGVQTVNWTGREGLWLEPSDPTMTIDSTRAIVVPRLGADIGGKHVRVRPGIELPLGSDGVDGFNATVALAYQW